MVCAVFPVGGSAFEAGLMLKKLSLKDGIIAEESERVSCSGNALFNRLLEGWSEASFFVVVDASHSSLEHFASGEDSFLIVWYAFGQCGIVQQRYDSAQTKIEDRTVAIGWRME